MEVHVESNFHLGPSIDVFNHFNALNNTQMRLLKVFTALADKGCLIQVKRLYVTLCLHCDINTASKNWKPHALNVIYFSSRKSIGNTFTQKCKREPKFRHSGLHYYCKRIPHFDTNSLLDSSVKPIGEVQHNSRIGSSLGCTQGALPVVLCTKTLDFASRRKA